MLIYTNYSAPKFMFAKASPKNIAVGQEKIRDDEVPALIYVNYNITIIIIIVIIIYGAYLKCIYVPHPLHM